MNKIEIYNKIDFVHVYNRINKKHYIMGINESEILHRYNAGVTVEGDEDFLNFLEHSSFFTKKKQSLSNIKLPFIKNFNPPVEFSKLLIRLLAIVSLILFVIIMGVNSFRIQLSFMQPNNSFEFLILLPFILGLTFFHELAHAFTAKIYGVAVPEIGLNFKFFIPLGYADISGVNYLKSKYQKINVILGGSLANLFIFCILFVINTFYHSEIIVNMYSISLIMILFNMFFYLKLDGYYIIEKLLEKENLICYNSNDFKGEYKYINLIIYLCFVLFSLSIIVNLLSTILRVFGVL